MTSRSLLKQLLLACALVSVGCGAEHKADDKQDSGETGDMDGGATQIFDDAGNVIGVVEIDDAGNVLVVDSGVPVGALDEAGQLLPVAVDDAGQVVVQPGTGSTIGDGGYLYNDGESPYPTNSSGQVLCGSEPCKCSDNIDNDNDGRKDTDDPECAAPWDNDENSLATGISGDNRDYACQDCFFDGNSGSGNDGCRLPSSCIESGNASSGQGSCNSCEQPKQCVDFCRSFAPNGCDCFGCCQIHTAAGIKHLMLGARCDIAADGTLTGDGCNECVQNTSCINTCGECELCAGKSVSDLPAKCFPTTTPGGDGGTSTPGSDGGTTPGSDGGTTTPGSDGGVVQPPPVWSCENGAQVCGGTAPACPAGDICSFGCCTRSPIILL